MPSWISRAGNVLRIVPKALLDLLPFGASRFVVFKEDRGLAVDREERADPEQANDGRQPRPTPGP